MTHPGSFKVSISMMSFFKDKGNTAIFHPGVRLKYGRRLGPVVVEDDLVRLVNLRLHDVDKFFVGFHCQTPEIINVQKLELLPTSI